MNLNERMAEIVRIDREIAERDVTTNVITLANRRPHTDLQRQRAAHVSALRAGAAR